MKVCTLFPDAMTMCTSHCGRVSWIVHVFNFNLSYLQLVKVSNPGTKHKLQY